MKTMSSQSISSLLAGMVRDPSQLTDQKVTGISLDSRTISAGNLFLSLASDSALREKYLKQALTADIAFVAYDNSLALSAYEQELLNKANVTAQAIDKLADKCGEIAARFYGHPSMALTVIAITGTNGKTSVSQFIAQTLESMGLPCAVIGTLGVGRINELADTGMTTPDPVSVQRVLAEFCQQGIEYVAIEASSHALSQGRLNSVSVDVAVHTNITRDHLDYHKTMADYAKAKSQLFDFDSLKTAVINSADELGQSLLTKLAKKGTVSLSSYSRFLAENKADFQAENIKMPAEGIEFDLATHISVDRIHAKLFGAFNVDNLLATIACLDALNIAYSDIINAIQQCHSVEGRMEILGGGEQATVVIDFAHTPDALIQALESLQQHVTEEAQLYCVFGCGGNRDKGKRPLMGAAVEQYSDKFVITDDNPRNEDPEQITSDILAGLADQQSVLIEHNRKLAITSIINIAKKGDIVLVAGKGHEQYQEVSGIKHPFSDKQVVEEALVAANDADITLREAN